MKTNQELQHELQEAFAAYPFKLSPGNLYEPIRYILSLGAKRMRPQLLLMGCDLFGKPTDTALGPAMGIEFFHNFTLMHDDIMDNAPLRRSNATVHQKWNSNIAILSGDAMFVQSVQLMMQVEESLLKPILELFCKTAIEVCEGQQLDMDFETIADVKIEDYLHMITLKTAVLLAASLEIGALIGGANQAEARHLYEFGKNIGIAFQLQDDYLDVYGDADKFGKQVGGDILSNKKTFLLLKAFELADDKKREELNDFLKNENDPEKKVQQVRALYDLLDVKNHSHQKMKTYFDKGMKHLQEINIPEENKINLYAFAEMLFQREH